MVYLSGAPRPIAAAPAPRSLVVDDEGALARMMAAILLRMGIPCQTAATLGEARARLARSQFDIVLLDLGLPDGRGVGLLEELRALPSPPLVVIITGQHELETALGVIRGGAYDFIPKPFSYEEFEERIGTAVREWRSRAEAATHRERLEGLVQAMTGKLHDAGCEVEHAHDMTVSALGAALDLRDPETQEHCRRVAECSVRLGRALGLEGEALRNLRWGAYLHDIGKIGVAGHILSKTSGLSQDEMRQVKVHPQLGYQMISRIEFLAEAAEVVLYHHEKFDGSGYPRALRGGQIPLAARIFAVADAFDAMTHDRPYRKASSFASFAEELDAQSARHFDPSLVERFLELPEEYWQMERRAARGSRQRIVDAVPSA